MEAVVAEDIVRVCGSGRAAEENAGEATAVDEDGGAELFWKIVVPVCIFWAMEISLLHTQQQRGRTTNQKGIV